MKKQEFFEEIMKTYGRHKKDHPQGVVNGYYGGDECTCNFCYEIKRIFGYCPIENNESRYAQIEAVFED